MTRQLVEGEACIAIGVNADFHLARKLARDSGHQTNIRYVIPQEGAMLWVDVLAIPADLRSDPTIYPDAAALQRLRMGSAHTDANSRQQNREFTRFRTGQ